MEKSAFEQRQSHETQSLSNNVLFNQFFPFTIFRDFYLAYVDQLPLYNPPNILGLHANVEINYLSRTAVEICVNMLNVQPEQQQVEEHSNRERKASHCLGICERLISPCRIRSLVDPNDSATDSREEGSHSDSTKISTTSHSSGHRAFPRDSPFQSLDLYHLDIAERTETSIGRSNQFLH